MKKLVVPVCLKCGERHVWDFGIKVFKCGGERILIERESYNYRGPLHQKYYDCSQSDEIWHVEDVCTQGAPILSPDAPVISNSSGGKQSDTGTRIDLFPPLSTLHVGAILDHGARKYGENNWHQISVNEHLNHLLTHAFAYLAGDTQDDHLGHLACRGMMALEIELRKKKGEKNE